MIRALHLFAAGLGLIAFISERTGHSDIYVMSHDGTAPKQVTVTSQVESAPAWSR